jgi:hypothetical protein
MLHAVFSFQFRNPCLPAPVPTEGGAGRRNPKSAFEYANFFMEETKYQFLKPDPAAYSISKLKANSLSFISS